MPEISQPQHCINTDGGHMSNYIRQNEVNVANEPLKVEKPLLGSSGEMDKLPCVTNTEHSPDTKNTVILLLKNLNDGEFKLTEPWSSKMFVEEAQN